LQIAKLDSAQNNGTQAIGDLSKALTLKNNYTDAYLFLAQLQASAGDTKSAIDSATNAAISAPNNPGIFFQLGLLRYDSKDYQDAIGALEQAVSLNNQYSNAKYFLGLSYYQVGRTADAITEFSDIQKLNPDSQQVADILANLKAGLAPLVGSQSAAVTSTPTGRTATSTTPSKAKAKK